METNNVTAFRAAVGLAEDTEHGRPGMVMAYGEAGRGKTLAAMNSYAVGGGVYLRVWENWTQAAFLQALCFEVDGSRPHGANRCKVRIMEALGDAPRHHLHRRSRSPSHRPPGRPPRHSRRNRLPHLPDRRAGAPRPGAGPHPHKRPHSPGTPHPLFEPISTRDISIYAQEAADLELADEACKVVHRLSKGNFRRAHNFILSLEQMAKAAQTGNVDGAMAQRLADGKGGRKGGKK